MTARDTAAHPRHEADLIELVAVLADSKVSLGRRYAEWCTAAPTLESAVAAAAMAQDEIGHARSFYPLLKDLASSGEERADAELDPETRTQLSSDPYLSHSFESWTDFVAANLVFDTALTVLLESATDSTLGPLAQRARRILEEEPLHWLHAEGWTRRLARSGPAVKGELNSSIARASSPAVAVFDTATAGLREAGVLAGIPEALRDTLRTRVNAVLTASDLATI